jgi:hypothetical protein
MADRQNSSFKWEEEEEHKKGVYYGDDEFIKKKRELEAMGSVRPPENEKAADNAMLMQIIFVLVAIVAVLGTYSFLMGRQVNGLKKEQLERCSSVVTRNLQMNFEFVKDVECGLSEVKIYVTSSWDRLSETDKKSFLTEVQDAVTNDYGHFPLLKSKAAIPINVYYINNLSASIDRKGNVNVK